MSNILTDDFVQWVSERRIREHNEVVRIGLIRKLVKFFCDGKEAPPPEWIIKEPEKQLTLPGV